MCDVIKDPFAFQNGDTTSSFLNDEEDDNSLDMRANDLHFSFDLMNPESNLEPDQLALYILIILLSAIQFSLIIRYFLRLQIYFDRLQ